MMRLSSLLRAAHHPAQAHVRMLPRHATAAALNALSMQQAAAFSSQSHLSAMRFTDLSITENSKRAIRQELKYEFLTDVQEKTFSHIMEGKDVLSKAKTGNGKTMAFLLPTIERMVRLGLDKTPNSIPLLVISPTRELAQQIATEARKIGQFHDLNVACFVGGTSVHKDTTILASAKPVDIVVATPGRLLDLVDQDAGQIKKMLRKLRFLVLDEADRLLDMGFRNEVMKILNSVPSQRQTLLFSATLPKSTQELTKLALNKDYELVNTVTEGDDQTNVQVKQEYVVTPASEVVATVEQVLAAHVALRPKDYKVIVFFPTARAAQFMAQLFDAAGFKGVLEMHSRKSQVVRTKTADKFRASKRVMMFSSDVSARGVDYPDVSLVLQVGLTDRDQYIHRLGRTARGGSDGHGILVLSDFEKPLLNELRDLPIKKLPVDEELPSRISETSKAIATLSQNKDLEKSAIQSYQAWLGFYHSNLRRLGINKEELVQLAEQYSRTIGLTETPRLEVSTLKKMGLVGVAGVEPAEVSTRRARTSRGGSRESAPREPRSSSAPPSSDWSDSKPAREPRSYPSLDRIREPRSDSPREPRSFSGDRSDRPREPRSFSRDRSDSPREPRSFSGDRSDRPREPRSFSNERPERSREPRTFSNVRPERQRDARSSSSDRSDRAPRTFSNVRPERQRDARSSDWSDKRSSRGPRSSSSDRSRSSRDSSPRSSSRHGGRR